MQEQFFWCDDGHGDYNRSYEGNYDIDYADYSTDHMDNNYHNFTKKIPRKKKTPAKPTPFKPKTNN